MVSGGILRGFRVLFFEGVLIFPPCGFLYRDMWFSTKLFLFFYAFFSIFFLWKTCSALFADSWNSSDENGCDDGFDCDFCDDNLE